MAKRLDKHACSCMREVCYPSDGFEIDKRTQTTRSARVLVACACCRSHKIAQSLGVDMIFKDFSIAPHSEEDTSIMKMRLQKTLDLRGLIPTPIDGPSRRRHYLPLCGVVESFENRPRWAWYRVRPAIRVWQTGVVVDKYPR